MAEPAPQPSFRQRLVDVFHPLRPAGGYALPHVLILAVILVVVAFLAGWFVSNRLSQHEVQAKYGHSLAVNGRLFRALPPHSPSPYPKVAIVPSAATINLSRFPDVGDQGPVGSCAAWVSAWLSSFEYRLTHPKSWLRFSPKWMYEHFGHGQDNGSYVAGDVAPFPTEGVPRFKQYPFPPWGLNWPEPALDAYGHSLAADALTLKQPVKVLYGGTGASAVEFIREQIASGHPVGIAAPVYQSFETATHTIDLPDLSREYVLGGHEFNGYAYDDNYRFPSGNVGGAHIRNQWGKNWCESGDCWISYAFIQQYAYEVTSIRLGAEVSAPAAPLSSVSSQTAFPQHATFSPPPLPKTTKATRGSAYWLSSQAPYASLVNAAGKRYSISPLGMEATFGTESNINPHAYRYTSYYDHSCGLSQITIPTARGYGLTGTDEQICNWLYVPANSIRLTARMFRDFKNHVCWSFSPLYASWNLGPGYGCKADIYAHPTNPITQQALHNWYDWRTFIRAKYGGPVPGDIGPCNGCRRTKPKHDS